MNFKNLILFIFIPLFSFSQKPYDTSTPEKLVEAMGNVGTRPATENPLPFLYDEATSSAIIAFDKIGEEGLASFNQFRRNLQNKFPTHIKVNKTGKIEITLDAVEGMNTRSFSYSVNLITPQIKERKPSDYKFISATEPDDNNVSKLTLLIMDNEKTIDIKKTKDGYKMFLTDDVLVSLSDMTEKCKKMHQVFVEANTLLESGEITEENFESKMEMLSIKYMESLE